MQGKVLPERGAVKVYVGIDVCKARLDIYLHPLGHTLSVGNDAEGLKKLKRMLKAHTVALIVVEATGKLHRAAHRSLDAGGFAVAVVNPLRARLFAQAAGALAKTDRIDARMLAILGESLKPEPEAPAPERLEALQELVRGRDAALAARTALTNQRGAAQTRVLAKEIERQLRAVESAIANLDAAIAKLIADDPALARRLAVLTSIPGVGAVTAAALIARLAEIGALSAREAAMMAGLAPIACETGDRSGARHIAGGRPHVRRALYMAALSATRVNPALKTLYARLRAKGKQAKVALVAVMRKLVILANTLVREDRTWQPHRA